MAMRWPEMAMRWPEMATRWPEKPLYGSLAHDETVSKPRWAQLLFIKIGLAGGVRTPHYSDRKPGRDLRHSDAVTPSVYVSQILDNAELRRQTNAT
jgi:hypothetical protein